MEVCDALLPRRRSFAFQAAFELAKADFSGKDLERSRDGELLTALPILFVLGFRIYRVFGTVYSS
jgi:hypothetical protein